MPDDVLDPHQSGAATGVTNVGVAGVPTPEPPKETLSEDRNILEREGRKYVPAEALTAEREARQKAQKVLSDIEPVLPEFEEFLKQKQARNASTVQRASAQTDSDYTADELEGFALNRGYVQADGLTPDINRAKVELDIITRVTDRRTDRRVQPLAAQSASDRSVAHLNRALTATWNDGEPIADPRYLEAAFKSLPKEYTSDENVANILQVVAAGLEYLDQRKTGVIRRGGKGREPMHVEHGSGRLDSDDGGLSRLELAAARARGKTPEQWAKTSKAANALQRGVLEEVS